MKKIPAENISLILALSLLIAGSNAFGHENHDPLLTHIMIDELELRSADGANPLALEAQGWIGRDREKFWIKTEIERRNSTTEEAEVQALYSRAIAPFWDIQTGIRHQAKPVPTRNWAVIGLQGLAPYSFELDTALFIGDSGATAARLKAEYELLFTQRLILSPNIEINFYGQNNPETGNGSGLANTQTGLRLRYEIRREFAPYIGVNWNRKFGKTADFAKTMGEDISENQWVVGMRTWF